MKSNQNVLIVIGLTAWAASSGHAAFVEQPDGSLLEDFNDGIVDTVTWTSNTAGQPLFVSESGGELKLFQTLGFNGAYSTMANGIDESDDSSDGSGWVEPKTAGNNNHRVRAIMRRKDNDTGVAMGLVITTNRFLRTIYDWGDYAGVIWQYNGGATDVSDLQPGDVLNSETAPRSQFVVEVRARKLLAENHIISPEIATPGSQDNSAPVWDYTGQTQYAFEVNWTTETSAEMSICTVRDEDQNQDCIVDIIDFGRFAGNFGKTGPMGTDFDGSDSDYDANGNVDIIDFGRLAGEFGQSSELYFNALDWTTDDRCGPSGSWYPCWTAESMGIQIYAHQPGTLWVDEVRVFGDGNSEPQQSPEPASLVMLGVAGLLVLRRRR